ncbi:hypothetical protein [Endozoicomonas lisbonensis]
MSSEVITLRDLHHLEKALAVVYCKEVMERCMYRFSQEVGAAYLLGASDNKVLSNYKPPLKGISESEFSDLLSHLNVMEQRAFIYALLTKSPIHRIIDWPWDFAYRHTKSEVMKDVLLNFNAEPFCDLAFWQREPVTLRPVALLGLSEKVASMIKTDFWKFTKRVEAGKLNLEQFIQNSAGCC